MNIKKSYFIIFLLLLLSIGCFSASYAIFMNKSEQHGKLNIVVGNLNYSIESDSLTDNKVTVDKYSIKEIKVRLSSLNDVSSKYELYYTMDSENSNIKVGYSSDTKDAVSGTIDANSSKTITLLVNNLTDTTATITFGVVGGLVNNDLVLTKGNSLNQVVTKEKLLSNEILVNNTLITNSPDLTTSSNNTSDKSGLYKSTLTNTGDSTYYFRGNVENNYVSFAGYTWRIVRINEDGTIRIIMQDGINDNTAYQFNSRYDNYTYMYYTNSEAKIKLEEWYQENIGSNTDLSQKVVTGDYYCEQAKVKYDDSYTTGDATMTTYTSYTPNFKCTTDGNGKGIVNASVGLITYDEVVYAGGYYGQSNSNYYLNNNKYFWTMSPAGFSGSTSSVWYVFTSGYVSHDSVNNTNALRPVLILKADTLATGDGTSNNPYVIK